MDQLSEALKSQKQATKDGKRIQKEEAIVAKVTPLLHKLNPFDNFNIVQNEAEEIFRILYSGATLTNKLSSMNKMATAVDIISMCFHSVASKQDYIAKLKDSLDQI